MENNLTIMAVFIGKRGVTNDMKFIFLVVQFIKRLAQCGKVAFHISKRHHAIVEMNFQSAVEIFEIGAKWHEC